MVWRSARRRDQRQQRDGAGNRRRARAAVGANGAAERAWAGRLYFLYQLRGAEGRGFARQSACRTAVSLEIAAAPDSHRRAGRDGR